MPKLTTSEENKNNKGKDEGKRNQRLLQGPLYRLVQIPEAFDNAAASVCNMSKLLSARTGVAPHTQTSTKWRPGDGRVRCSIAKTRYDT